MKPKHRRMRRRYSGKRKQARFRWKLTLVLIFAFFAVVIVGSIFLGQHLKEKAEASREDRLEWETEGQETVTPPEISLLFPGVLSVVNADYLPLDKLGEISETAGGQRAILLKNKNGELFYSSPVAQTLGSQSTENGLLSAGEIVSAIKEKSEYVSVYLPLMSHTEENGSTTDAVHAFETALACEIAEAGADEVILCFFEDMNENTKEMLCSISDSYRKTVKTKTPLGLMLPYSFFMSEGANKICLDLSKHFELLAVDFTDVATIIGNEGADTGVETSFETDTETSSEMNFEEEFLRRIDSIQMYLSRYSMRVILDSDLEDLEMARALLSSKAVYSVGTLSYRELYSDANG